VLTFLFTHAMKFLLLLWGVFGSFGDQQYIFTDCVEKCKNECNTVTIFPLALRITGWTCLDNCKYNCMHIITDLALENKEKVYQYFGKWPFYRLGGMQEPASVLFSLLNGYYHFRGVRRYSKLIGNRFPWRGLMVFYGICSVNVWVWSSVFHTRDLPFTEKVDFIK
jgi:post-GPI attachment to proteins factor 3